ncbi:DNA-binding transcriptional LysR family regulator [Bradyrhizobium sp. USDA 4516]
MTELAYSACSVSSHAHAGDPVFQRRRLLSREAAAYNRTTRSVAPTPAGERLLRSVGPKFEEMDAELSALGELREKPAGNIRITATEHAAEAILLPALAKMLPNYPDISVEVIVDYGLANIVAQRYDAGTRSGELVAKDMTAVRVGPDLRSAVVGAPSYFANRKRPRPPPGSDQPQLPEPAPADPWRALRLGIREGRARAQRAGRRPARLQRRRPAPASGVEQLWPRIPDGA